MMPELIRDEQVFPLGEITSAEVGLRLTSGALRVRGGAAEFCEAVFEYSHPELKPEVAFESDGGEAELIVKQPRFDTTEHKEVHWELAFNNDVQIELEVQSASGGVDLDLTELRPRGVEVDSASGEVSVRLGGANPELDEVTVESKSGSIELGLNGEFPALERLEVDSMSGKVRIAVAGACPELGRIAVDSKSGAVEVDLSAGTFGRDDLGVRVESVSGKINVTLPEGVGASLQANVLSGQIRAEGFERSEGGRKVNAAFGTTPATIWLNLSAVSGSINVRTA